MKLVGEKQLIWEPGVRRRRANISRGGWRNTPKPRASALQEGNYISGIALHQKKAFFVVILELLFF